MEKHIPSLRRQMSWIILLCWLLPMAIAATGVGWYLLSGVGRQKEQAIFQQFQLNLQLAADRVNSAAEASRLPSYDPELRDAWSKYRQDREYAPLYRQCSSLLLWAACVTLDLGRDAALTVKGEDTPGGHDLEYAVRQPDFTLQGCAAVDYHSLMAGFQTYPWLLGAMGLSLLLFTFRFFRRKISWPIRELMEGAARIRQGELGYQIEAGTGSREFRYLTDSFNQMSGQLRRQFDRLYQEALARRDAQARPLFRHCA